jgi:hypothetical protein
VRQFFPDMILEDNWTTYTKGVQYLNLFASASDARPGVVGSELYDQYKLRIETAMDCMDASVSPSIFVLRCMKVFRVGAGGHLESS